MYHRNSVAAEDSYMANALLHTNIKGNVQGYGADPMLNRNTGAMVEKVSVATSSTFAITVLTSNTDTAQEFEEAIAAKSASFVTSASTVRKRRKWLMKLGWCADIVVPYFPWVTPADPHVTSTIVSVPLRSHSSFFGLFLINAMLTISEQFR